MENAILIAQDTEENSMLPNRKAGVNSIYVNISQTSNNNGPLGYSMARLGKSGQEIAAHTSLDTNDSENIEKGIFFAASSCHL